jgi:putative ABC transport system substrate-binding protein
VAASPYLRGVGVRRSIVVALGVGLLAVALAPAAQSARLYRMGVIHHAGSYEQAIAGLRDGLKELGFEQGEQYLLHMRDAHGDLRAVGPVASSLEAGKLDLICAFSNSTALRAKQATKSVPIVFRAGTDPVKAGLVASFSK